MPYNFEFEDVTKEGEEDFFKYNFSFDITDSKGTLDYDGYIFESDRDYELDWGQKKPEDWKKADTEILIDALEDWKNIKMAKGGGVGSQTLAPKSDRIYGSEKNAKGSASSEKSASKISLSAKIIKALENKLEDFKKTNKTKKVSLNDLKAVYRRGLGAYSSSHRPTISGGKPNTRNAWAMARVNKFLLKAGGTKVKKAYVQDDDLLKMAKGGGVGEVLISDEDYDFWIGGDKNLGKAIKQDGVIVGGIAYDKDDQQINGIIIKNKFRKKGLAKKAIKALFDKNPDLDRVYVRSVPESKGFWNKIATDFDYYNEDAGLWEGYVKRFEDGGVGEFAAPYKKSYAGDNGGGSEFMFWAGLLGWGVLSYIGVNKK